jgi:hypothetical protein
MEGKMQIGARVRLRNDPDYVGAVIALDDGSDNCINTTVGGVPIYNRPSVRVQWDIDGGVCWYYQDMLEYDTNLIDELAEEYSDALLAKDSIK